MNSFPSIQTAALEPQDAPTVAEVEIPAGYTPGPWSAHEVHRPPIGGGRHDTDANGNIFWGYSIWGSDDHGASILPTIAAVHNFPDQVEANARLIALAPAMAEELVALRSQNDALMRERTSMIATHRENRALAEKRHAAELANLRARVAEMEAGLAHFAIIETYDYPGDVPESCGWWCNLCKEHVELDGSGHHADCMIAGQMPASTPPASQEGQADAD